MTQNIKIKRREGDEITFKLRKVESFQSKVSDEWNELGLWGDMKQSN